MQVTTSASTRINEIFNTSEIIQELYDYSYNSLTAKTTELGLPPIDKGLFTNEVKFSINAYNDYIGLTSDVDRCSFGVSVRILTQIDIDIETVIDNRDLQKDIIAKAKITAAEHIVKLVYELELLTNPSIKLHNNLLVSVYSQGLFVGKRSKHVSIGYYNNESSSLTPSERLINLTFYLKIANTLIPKISSEYSKLSEIFVTIQCVSSVLYNSQEYTLIEYYVTINKERIDRVHYAVMDKATYSLQSDEISVAVSAKQGLFTGQ